MIIEKTYMMIHNLFTVIILLNGVLYGVLTKTIKHEKQVDTKKDTLPYQLMNHVREDAHPWAGKRDVQPWSFGKRENLPYYLHNGKRSENLPYYLHNGKRSENLPYYLHNGKRSEYQSWNAVNSPWLTGGFGKRDETPPLSFMNNQPWNYKRNENQPPWAYSFGKRDGNQPWAYGFGKRDENPWVGGFGKRNENPWLGGFGKRNENPWYGGFGKREENQPGSYWVPAYFGKRNENSQPPWMMGGSSKRNENQPNYWLPQAAGGFGKREENQPNYWLPAGGFGKREDNADTIEKSSKRVKKSVKKEKA